MKSISLIFFTGTTLFFILFYLSTIWFLAGIFLCMVYIAFRYHHISINGLKNRIYDLSRQNEDIHGQLDILIVKEAKYKREAEQISKSKSKLLSSLSHEIRTPMTGVFGMATLLTETNLTKEQSEYTETILSSGKKLLTKVNDILINDMLDFSKMNSDDIELDHKNFDLRNCIEEVLDMFAGKAAESGLELLYQIDRDVPIQLTGDYKRLQQVLINLIENAVKFTSDGEVLTEVHLISNENNKLELSYTVSDTGIGIENDKLEKLFSGFMHTTTNANNKREGKGFGLAICKKLVELMGGSIKAENLKDKGSIFTFNIKIDLPEHTIQNISNKMFGFEGKQILVVDDNVTAGNIIKNQLEDLKLLPILSLSGRDALEILTQVPVDLIMVDLNMQEMDGIELGKRIRKERPGIPVILLNSLTDERYKENEEVFSAVINKPIKQHIMINNIVNELRHSDKSAESESSASQKLSENFSKKFPLKILVAEDNPINQKWTTRILAKLGYSSTVVENGKEVLELVSHEQFDLILMDVQMPEMDGLEATRMIRLCLESQPVIIAMTANVMQGDREECIQCGMDDYISKPVELTELVKMLEKWSIFIKEKHLKTA